MCLYGQRSTKNETFSLPSTEKREASIRYKVIVSTSYQRLYRVPNRTSRHTHTHTRARSSYIDIAKLVEVFIDLPRVAAASACNLC